MQINSKLLEDYLRATRELKEGEAKHDQLPEDEWDILMDGLWAEWECAYYNLLDEYEEYDLNEYGISADILTNNVSLKLAKIEKSG